MDISIDSLKKNKEESSKTNNSDSPIFHNKHHKHISQSKDYVKKHYINPSSVQNTNHHHYFSLIILFFFLASVIIFSFFFMNIKSPTGEIIATGGNVSKVNVKFEGVFQNWQGVYGTVGGENNLNNINLFYDSSTSVVKYDLKAPECSQTKLYFSNVDSIDFDSLRPAMPNEIDTFYNISPTGPFSATKVFTTMETFEVEGRMLNLFSVNLASNGNDFFEGIAMDGSGNPVFVSQIRDDVKGFNNDTINYQIMLPIATGNEITGERYYVLLDNDYRIDCALYLNIIVKDADANNYISKNMTENIPVNFSLRTNLFSNETVAFSASIDMNFTYIDSTHVIATFIPTNQYTYNQSITFYAIDSNNETAEQMVYFFVNPINEDPEIFTTSYDGYVYEEIRHFILTYDPDNVNFGNSYNDNIITFEILNKPSWMVFNTYLNETTNQYYGTFEFIPYQSQTGTFNITIIIFDGIVYKNTSMVFNIGFCGDLDPTGVPKCDQEYETCETCETDCGVCNPLDEESGLSLYIDMNNNRNCNGSDIIFNIYETSIRGECETEGIMFNGGEICGNASNAKAKLSVLENMKWISYEDYTADKDGKLTLRLPNGIYLLKAESSKYNPGEKMFEIGRCNPFEELLIPVEVKDNNTIITNQNTTETKPATDQPSVQKSILEKIMPVLYVVGISCLVIGTIFAINRFYFRKKNI